MIMIMNNLLYNSIRFGSEIPQKLSFSFCFWITFLVVARSKACFFCFFGLNGVRYDWSDAWASMSMDQDKSLWSTSLLHTHTHTHTHTDRRYDSIPRHITHPTIDYLSTHVEIYSCGPTHLFFFRHQCIVVLTLMTASSLQKKLALWRLRNPKACECYVLCCCACASISPTGTHAHAQTSPRLAWPFANLHMHTLCRRPNAHKAATNNMETAMISLHLS
jgi:hypothetical protein